MSWPWKKKSSGKHGLEKGDHTPAAAYEIGAAQVNKGKQDNNSKNTIYVQISKESHAHLIGLEDQLKLSEARVQTLEDEVKALNQKLSVAHSEITEKENLVKQHAKVAEEGVSGWEKAEEEAASLKSHLESVTLLKLNAEDRASHLDSALKECMKQIRNLKEENEQNLHEVILNRTKLFDEMKQDLEAKIGNLNQQIWRSAAENDALSKSLQERSNMLIKLSEEKSQADAEIERLKSKIELCEKDINSMKYELHIASKEVEIRNEERNMSVRSAEVANKQHLDGVKKIAKLEAECQRLRGLVRKKLPGPAALAQMKLEVENLSRDYGESHLKRSPRKPTNSHFSHLPEFSFDNPQKYHKENELLIERLVAMDEETRMLKEAFSQCNGELRHSRNLCAEMAGKIQSLEAQLQGNDEQSTIKGFANERIEDGNDDNPSYAGSLATVSMSEFSYNRDKNIADSPHGSRNSNHIDLMDDFLEMEKLAYEFSETDPKPESSLDTQPGDDRNKEPPKEDEAISSPQPRVDPLIFVELRSKISSILESISNDKDANEVIDHVRQAMRDLRKSFSEDVYTGIGHVQSINQELETAISRIYDFVMMVGKEAKSVPGLNGNLTVLSSKYGDAINSEIPLTEFVLDISHVIHRASELHFKLLGFKTCDTEVGNSVCIDKIVLPENKAAMDSSKEGDPNAHCSDSSFDPDVPNNGNLSESWKCSLEEFEQLKIERDGLKVDLAECTENFESTKSQLLETEQILGEVKSQLTSAQKSNSLAETQLKCMAESYKSLEKRAEELQSEVNLLQRKIENLHNELKEEKRSHQDTLARCNDLLEQLQRIESSTAADNNKKDELAAAAEKLAECQETIHLLSKQLKTLRPQTDHFLTSPYRLRTTPKAELPIAIEEQHTTTTGMTSRDINPSEFEGNRTPLRSRHTRNHLTVAGSTSTPDKQNHHGFIRFFSSKGKNAC